MEGTLLAVLGSVALWGLSYLATFYLLSFSLSQGLLPRGLRSKSTHFSAALVFGIVALGSIIGTGMLYRIGGEMEAGQGVAWGCYVEDFQLLVTILWMLGGLVNLGLLVAALIDPGSLKYSNRLNPALMFVGQAVISIFVAKISSWCIPLLAADLTGLDASCL